MSTMTLTRQALPDGRVGRPRVAPAAPRVRSAGPRSGHGELRLTRRGRLVVVLGTLLVLLALAFFWGAGSVATGRSGTPEPTRVVLVDQGDTLWGIAAEVAGEGDVRAMVDRIERLNALESANIMVGQRLRVPVAD